MLTFLFIAAKKNFLVESYDDFAEGIMKKNKDGRLAMTEVTLKPEIVFGGDKIPTKNQIDEMHHQAHEECFIANSVKTKIVVEHE